MKKCNYSASFKPLQHHNHAHVYQYSDNTPRVLELLRTSNAAVWPVAVISSHMVVFFSVLECQYVQHVRCALILVF